MYMLWIWMNPLVLKWGVDRFRVEKNHIIGISKEIPSSPSIASISGICDVVCV